MHSHFEASLQRDIERLRAKVREMSVLAEDALRQCLKALKEQDRTLAYSIILRDRRINELEKEVDRLCLEFLVRQQPVAGPLRLAYATIRINLELERVGDYAEGIARQILKLSSMNTPIPFERFQEIANLSIPMLHDAVESFVKEDPSLAHRIMETEATVDALKSRLNADLMRLNRESGTPFEGLNALMMIARHFERVSDQAKNICLEVIYMCTGEYERHGNTQVTRLLFVDKRNSCRSQMAEAIAESLGRPEFVFNSAGLTPTSIDPATVAFLKEKGLDASRQTSKSVSQIPNLSDYQIIVALTKEAEKIFPQPPTRTICLDWSVKDPAQVQGDPEQVRVAYEETFQFILEHITGLVSAIAGNHQPG